MNLVTEAYGGQHCKENAPSLWCLPWVTDNKGKVHVLVRDPFPTRGETDLHDRTFIHMPARKLSAAWGEFNATMNELYLNTAIEHILHYYMGHDPQNLGKDGTVETIARITSPLFSGPRENQQVLCVSVCLGKSLETLPPILTQDQDGTYPLTMSKDYIPTADRDRGYVGWGNLKTILQGILYADPRPFEDLLPEAFFSPSVTPFRFIGEKLTKKQPFDVIKIQGSVLSMYKAFNKKILTPDLRVKVASQGANTIGGESCLLEAYGALATARLNIMMQEQKANQINPKIN